MRLTLLWEVIIQKFSTLKKLWASKYFPLIRNLEHWNLVHPPQIVIVKFQFRCVQIKWGTASIKANRNSNREGEDVDNWKQYWQWNMHISLCQNRVNMVSVWSVVVTLESMQQIMPKKPKKKVNNLWRRKTVVISLGGPVMFIC